jgi:glycosyltransferase involved in cell wall biosynthesis
MRVLLATDALPTPPRGGLDLHVSELLSALPSRGVTVQVAPLSSLHLRHVLRDTRPDIIHFHSLGGLSARLPKSAKESGAVVLWTLHDFHSLCPRTHLHDGLRRPCAGPSGGRACGSCFGGVRRLFGGPLFTRRYAAMRASLSACDRLIVPSQFVRNVFLAEGYPAAKLVVIAPATARPSRIASPPDPGALPRFVYAGDMRRSKGAALLLRALVGFKTPCEVVLHGGPPAPPAPREQDYEAELRSLSKGRAVRFAGRYAPGDLAGLLDGALALVVPSIVRESFGRTANEALLAGVPVIAAGEGGLAEQVQDGINGFGFEAGDADSLRRAMQRMIQEGPVMSARNGVTEGRPWPAAPDFSGELDKLVTLYEGCL